MIYECKNVGRHSLGSNSWKALICQFSDNFYFAFIKFLHNPHYMRSVHLLHWDQSTQQLSFLKELVWDRFSWERPEQQPIKALEEMTQLLSAFSSKTFAVSPISLKMCN